MLQKWMSVKTHQNTDKNESKEFTHGLEPFILGRRE